MITKQQAYKKLEDCVKDVVNCYESDTFSSEKAKLTHFDKQVLETSIIEHMISNFNYQLNGILLLSICIDKGLGVYKYD